MELMLFRPKEFELHYSCNYTVPQSILGDHRILCSFYFLTAFFLVCIYVPCLYIILRSDFIQQSCYKIMFFIGLLDIPGLVLSGILTGIFGFFNIGFCHSPKLFYFLGCFAEFTWHAQTLSSILLAINRCMVMTTRNAADLLFSGPKTWLTLLIPLGYAIFAFFFTQPVIFSPVLMTWLFNPHFGVLKDPQEYFVSKIHITNNFLIVASIPTIYTIFSVIRKLQERKYVNREAAGIKKPNTVFYQVLVICCSTTSLGILYVLMQFIAFPTEVYFLAQFLWITYTGSAAIIYLTMNKNIRNRVLSIFRKDSPNVSPFIASTVGSQNSSRNI